MDDAFGSDFYEIFDENGQKFMMEHLDTLELGETEYVLFLPADMQEDDPDYGLVILKVLEEDGESVFAAIDDDAEREMVYEKFMQQLFDEE